MLMQSPPMQAAGKSHSLMSVGNQRGGESQGQSPLSQPKASEEPWVGPTPHGLSWIWMGAGHGVVGLLTVGPGVGAWAVKVWDREEQASPPALGLPSPSQRLRSLDRW